MSVADRGTSRRKLLDMGWRSLALAGVSGSFPQISRASGSAGSVLVCLYLVGGSDGSSLIVPLGQSQYAAYASLRGPVALNAGDLLPIRTVKSPGEYGLHPALSELQDLYNRGYMAVVANVGAPRATQGSSPHDYDSMTFLRGGVFTPAFAALHAGIGVTSADHVLATGRGTSVISLDGSASSAELGKVSQAAGGVNFRTQFPDTSLGQTLKNIAALIQASRASGISRPVITAAMGGFDTHQNQLADQTPLFQSLSGALGAFFSATQEMNLARNVTLFTDSEFGRSMNANAAGGTDHGWGNHHIVIGGSVAGADVYGTFPDMTASARDAYGGWVPTTSRDQYLATIANWAGMSSSDLSRAFPSLSGNANLGFLV